MYILCNPNLREHDVFMKKRVFVFRGLFFLLQEKESDKTIFLLNIACVWVQDNFLYSVPESPAKVQLHLQICATRPRTFAAVYHSFTRLHVSVFMDP